jgi:hypothetical protein
MRETPGSGFKPAMISSAPAICGTRRGLTKETASTRLTPASSSLVMKSIRSSTESGTASFCSPSRGPTSTIWMGLLMGRRDQVLGADLRTYR